MIRQIENPVVLALRKVPAWAIVLIAYTAIVITLWLPFGLRPSATFEEWEALREHDHGVFAYPDTFPTRPLILVVAHLGFLLTPGSFRGLNILLAILLVARGLMLYLLLCKLLPGQRTMAFAAGLLGMVYPAIVGLMSLRTWLAHIGVVTFLIAVYGLLWMHENLNWRTISFVVLTQAITLLSYETCLPLLLVSSLVIVWLDKRISRHSLRDIAIWCIVPVVFACVFIDVTLSSSTYTAQRLAQSGLSSDVSVLVQQVFESVRWVYEQHFWTSWQNALESIEPSFLTMAIIATLLTFVPVGIWLSHVDTKSEVSIPRRILLLVSVVACVYIGYLMYFPTDWRLINWRIFFYSSLGAAIVVALVGSLIGLLAGRLKWLAFILLMCPLIIVSVVRALDEHRQSFDLSQLQLSFVADVVTQAPSVAPDSLILFIDRQPDLSYSLWRTCSFASICVNAALTDVYYPQSVQSAVCIEEDGRFADQKFGDQCNFGQDAISVRRLGESQLLTFPYSRVMVFVNNNLDFTLVHDLSTYRPAGGSDLYLPDRLIDHAAPPAARVYTMFPQWPFTARAATATQSLSINFDREFHGGIRTAGWSFTERGVGRWMNSPVVLLETWLADSNSYKLRANVGAGLQPDILPSLRLSVNQTPIALSMTPEPDGTTTISGVIPQSVIAADTTKTLLKFTVSRVISPAELGINLDQRTLGVLFRQLQITPGIDAIVPAPFTIDFDSTVQGTGWVGPEPDAAWTGISHRWMTSPPATLVNELTSVDYQVAFRVGNGMTSDILESLSPSVSGQKISLKRRIDALGYFVL